MKKCNKCDIEKDLGEFYKKHDTKDGYSYTCKKCDNERNAKRRKTEKYKAKRKDYEKRYSEENLEKIKAYQKEYVIKNREKRRLYNLQWRHNNPLKVKAQQDRSWNKTSRRYKHRINEAKRRATKNKATFSGFDKEIAIIYDKCPPGYHVDHIVPLRGKDVCGLHVPWNLQYLPASENRKKNNKLIL